MYHFDVVVLSLNLPTVPVLLDLLIGLLQLFNVLVLFKTLDYLAEVVLLYVFEVLLMLGPK